MKFFVALGRITGIGVVATFASTAIAATPADLLAGYTAQAKAPASSQRGQNMFNTNFDKDFGWSCATCHGAVPTRAGQHASTGKEIAPLAPAANPERFTDRTKVEFHFRMNCRDVVGRECTAGEKADLLSWLLTLKP